MAAGAFNPFNFRRMMNNWKAKEMLASATEFYPAMETICGQKFFFPRQVLKIFSGADERRLWERTCDEKEGLFADANVMENNFSGVIDAPAGIGVVNGGGNVDCGTLIYAAREKLAEQNAIRETVFDFEKLKVSENEVVYDETIFSSSENSL